MTTEDYEDIAFILKELENIHYPAGPLFQRIQRCKALSNQNTDELKVIYNLVESHSPGLRNKAVLRYERLLTNEVEPVNNIPLLSTKDDIAIKCPTNEIEDNIKAILKRVEEMPQEWTLVQLTPQYNPLDNINEDNELYYTTPIHISVFNCGRGQEKPFMVTVDAPKDPANGNKVELVQEMMSIIVGNKEALSSNKQKTFKSQKEKLSYLSRRQTIEDRLRAIIKDIQDMWLREWRCLLSGKYIDKNLEDQIKYEIANFFKSNTPPEEVSEKSKALLGYIVKGTRHLKLMEIKSAVQFCFPQIEDKAYLRSVMQFVKNLGDKLINKGANLKKHPVILIIDDSLDCFPWEMINTLQDEPVSRVPSLHFIYCLFKEHEKDIVNGHKIVTDFDKGAYIVNPDMDLKNMEIRMMTFFNYWTPNWIGTSGSQPGSDEFFELLTSSDIFSYNGHGSGSHLFSLDKIQRTHVKAVVLLFGCGSTKINRMDPQVEMYGPYHMYLIARCPCVVGMLWEVTDLDTDILTTEFMSQWIPSEAPLHWKHVDKSKWNKAEDKIKFVRNRTPIEQGNNCEPELLRALSLSKKTVSFYGTKAACVVRGLPVKIQFNQKNSLKAF